MFTIFIRKDLWYVTIRPARPAVPNFIAEQDICKMYPYRWYCKMRCKMFLSQYYWQMRYFYAKYLNIFCQVTLQNKTSNMCMRCSYPMSQPNETPETFLTRCQCPNKMPENVLPSTTAKWKCLTKYYCQMRNARTVSQSIAAKWAMREVSVLSIPLQERLQDVSYPTSAYNATH